MTPFTQKTCTKSESLAHQRKPTTLLHFHFQMCKHTNPYFWVPPIHDHTQSYRQRTSASACCRTLHDLMNASIWSRKRIGLLLSKLLC